MQWITSLRSGLITLVPELRRTDNPSVSAQAAMEQVRQAILATMDDAGLDGQHAALLDKVSYAGSIQTLWYARTDLMMALSASRGEAYAQEQLDRLSRCFFGLLPEARHCRSDRRPR
jgi:hypothetical protein